MKCDEFLRCRETGSFLAKARARIHAARCPACADAWRRFTEFRRGLAEPAAIGMRERALWMGAVGSGLPARRRRMSSLAFAGVAAAALIVAAAVWISKDGKTPQIMGPGDVRVSALGDEIRLQDEAIRGGLAALSEELDALSHQAALLDVRRQIQQLLPSGGTP
jgi:ferric-dicitrate binding protein FerR (iron transport regulator)